MTPTNTITIRSSSIVAEYVKLMKPELTLLSVLTAVGSSYLALHGSVQYFTLLHTFIGTTLVGGAAGALNQYIERQYDAMMKRTERRPLPAGHISPKAAVLFGNILAVSGISYLSLVANLTAGILAVLTLVSYLFIYTPLKRHTPFATVVGGIPGAIPPLIGWSVVRGSISMEAWSLFFILFFWQMPHFLSLAWMYRKDYDRAGYRMLTVLDCSGKITSRQILFYTLALLPASLLPTLVGLTGLYYTSGALVLTGSFLLAIVRFLPIHVHTNARKIFFLSLFYLPSLFLLLMGTS
jgi:heme o synthase